MIKIILSLLLLAVNLQAFALEMVCEGWHQNPGAQIQKSIMVMIEQTNLNWKQSTELSGYKYEVNWDINLDTIYTNIIHNGTRLLFTTARVPTYPHNDSFTDLILPNGPRLSVSCNFK